MLRVVALLLSAFCLLLSQPLAFEAAYVKANHSGSGSSHTHIRGVNLEMTNVPLSDCIQQAFTIKPEQLSAPDWVSDERFDIVAKAPQLVKNPVMMQMLQNFLVTQFKLTFHHEEKVLAGYALVVEKKGLKMKPVEGTEGSIDSHNGAVTVKEVTMAQLARFLGRVVGAQVVDETKTAGNFSFDFTFVRSQAAADTPNGLTIFEAITDFGLKLEERKLPTEMLIVDHMERAPIEN